MKIRLSLLLLLLFVSGQVSSYQPIAQFDLRDNLNDYLNPASHLNFHSSLASPYITTGRDDLPSFNCTEGDYYSLPTSTIADISPQGTFTIYLWVHVHNKNPLSSDIVNLKVTSPYDTTFTEVRIADNQIQVGSKIVDFSQKIALQYSYQNIALVLANYGASSKYIDIYLQGHLILREYIDDGFQIQDILFGKQFNGIISDIKIYREPFYDYQVKQIEDPSYIQNYDFSHVKGDLYSYYPLRDGSLQDSKQISPNLLIEGNVELTLDKFGWTNRAIKLVNQEIKLNDLSLQLYDSGTNQNSAYSVSFQGYRDFPFQNGENILQVYTQDGHGISGYSLGWDVSDFIQTQKWQTYSITFETIGTELLIKYYIGHYLVQQDSRSGINGILKITQVIVGNNPQSLPYDSSVIVNDLIIHQKDLNKWEVSYITDLIQELVDFNAPPPPPPPTNCLDLLKQLDSSQVSLSLDIIYEVSFFKQIYTVSFGDFNNLEECFLNDVTFDHPTLGQQQIPINRAPGSSQIDFSFSHNDASNNGCLQSTVNANEMQCNFQLQVSHQGTVQMTKQFTSIIRTPDLNDIQNGLQLQIIGDNSEIFTNFDQAIQTEINFCTDATCSTPKTDLVLVRNEITYIQLRIITEGFNNYYPIHKSLKLGTTEIVPENLSEVQNWSQQGFITYAVKPHFSSNTMMLSIQIALSENPPATTPGNPGNGSGRRLQQVDNDLSLGKSVYVQVLESKKQFYSSEKLDYILKLSFGLMTFISVMTVTAVVGFIKYQTIQKPQYRSTQQVDSSKLENL